jgi:predicted HTH transcriptional regulator
MIKLSEILKQPEGRKLEFKETIPSKANLAKTIISFANDAGGEFYKINPARLQG